MISKNFTRIGCILNQVSNKNRNFISPLNQYQKISSKNFHTTNILRKMKVVPIDALGDNYMYLIIDEVSKECAVVDPVEPKKVLSKIKELNLKLTSILTTHHHYDHAEGNPELSHALKVPVYGGDDRVAGLTNAVSHNESLKIGTLDVKCLHTPCHTTGHICYFVQSTTDNVAPIVFTGDTLFIAGCGNFFEGNGKDMHRALIEILGKLPENTLVYCGHEYTTNNLKFARHIEPQNNEVAKKLEWCLAQRAQNLRTVPSTIGEEKLTNPFMRVDLKYFQDRYSLSSSTATMDAVRKEKSAFKPK